ncbi:MAG: shikimate dehydrogenase [Bacteroidota bacterium]|nr:shikimate dehydrogenase [Bacteroidota bacterium]
MRLYGLLGRNIDYSFSRKYFTEKFNNERIKDAVYQNFDVQSINDFSTIIQQNPTLKGLNVTIPYKEQIIPYLTEVSEQALQIGAVNTVKIVDRNNIIGYNTDVYGFEMSLFPMLKPTDTKALIFGTGGASKAVQYVFNQKGIIFKVVSRNIDQFNTIGYDKVNDLLPSHTILINTTPLGTFPNVDQTLDINYNLLAKTHLVFDLVYNPKETLLMKKAKSQGAKTQNGYHMLVNQAEKSWEIWNS